MTCYEFNERFVDYRSGDLPSNERARCEAHLIRCSPCVVYLCSYDVTLRYAKIAFSRPDDGVPNVVPHDFVRTILAARLRTRP